MPWGPTGLVSHAAGSHCGSRHGGAPAPGAGYRCCDSQARPWPSPSLRSSFQHRATILDDIARRRCGSTAAGRSNTGPRTHERRRRCERQISIREAVSTGNFPVSAGNFPVSTAHHASRTQSRSWQQYDTIIRSPGMSPPRNAPRTIHLLGPLTFYHGESSQSGSRS